MGQGEYLPLFLFALMISFLQKTARVQACLGCQQAWAKCQVGGLRTVPQKRTREEESLEEVSSCGMWGARVEQTLVRS